MGSENILNKDFCCNFDERVFIFYRAQSVMPFFRKFIYYSANRIVIIKIEKIDNKVYSYILLSFDEHEKKYEKIIVTIIKNLRTTISITISNVLIDNNLYLKSIIITNNNLQNTHYI